MSASMGRLTQPAKGIVMLNHIYIDNYKCFSNFEYKPQAMQLLLGENGSGKTTVFDVLEILRDFICYGHEAATKFRNDTLTAWDKRNQQTFELGLAGNGGQYKYRLVIEHVDQPKPCRIQSEELTFDSQLLYSFNNGQANMFLDDSSAGPMFTFDGSRSVIGLVPEGSKNKLLIWFRNRISKIYVLAPLPHVIKPDSDVEFARPDRLMIHLVSWLRHLSQESIDSLSQLRKCLIDDVLNGLTDMNLQKVSENSRSLKFTFKFSEGEPFTIGLNQLSTGQCMLVALYSILYGAVKGDAIVCIDEPDNFVALREIQPWLTALNDRVMDVGSQCLLISHHPELINYFAAKNGILFHRDESGPVRARPFEWHGDEFLKPAEILARGWE